jgi:hypothetical protein
MKSRGSASSATLVLVCVVVLITAAQAQYRGSLQGTVTDAQGAVVPGARVSLVDKETNRTLDTTSDESGHYSFNGLAPRPYKMEVVKEGFKKKALDDITIIAEQNNALNVELDIGQATETVNVTDAAPLIDTATANLNGTVTADQIQKLPSFGRDVFQLLQLAPGAFGDGSQSAGGGTNNLPGNAGPGGPGNNTGIFAIENGPQISVGGGRREVNNYQIDGVGITSVTWAGTAVITPNEDSVKEVKVVTNAYDAEDGRYSGAQVKVISQNGTNQYHGSLFFKADRAGLNAFNKYNGYAKDPVRNNARFNEYGGSVGGPIIHDRLFGFFAYETVRDRGTTTKDTWFETDQFRSGLAAPVAQAFFSFPGVGVVPGTVQESAADAHKCADILLVEGVNCRFIEGQGLDLGRPLVLPVGTQDPSFTNNLNPGLGGDGTGDPSNLDGIPDIQFIRTERSFPSTKQQFSGRVDFQLTKKDLIAVSGYWVPNHSESFNGSFRPMNAYVDNFKNRAATILWNRTFSPTLLNELRANASGWRWYSLGDNSGAPWGLPQLQVLNLGGTGIGNLTPGDTSSNLNGFGVGPPSEFNQWTYAVKDVLTKVHGSHTIKMGGEMTRLLAVDAAPWNARPLYSFNNMWDLLNDAPVSESGSFDPVTGIPSDFRKDTRSTLYGFFAQDDWKVRPNLTVTLGLRWEYFGPLSEKSGKLGIVELGSGADAVTGLRVRKGGNLYNASKKDFGPQVGFAWSPERFNQKFVVRGGFGIGYTGFQEANSLDGRNNPPFVSFAPQIQGDQIVFGLDTFPADVNSFGGYAPNPATTAEFDPETNLPLPGPNFAKVGLVGFQGDWPDTKTYRYSLDTQYDLGHDWVASIGYQGTATRNLTQSYNYYLFASGKLGLGVNAFNPVARSLGFYDNQGRGNFNALLTELRHRFGNTFQFTTQYRWSKSMDTGSNNYYGGNYQFTQDREYGPSDYDTTHAFKAFGIWSPIIFRGNQGWLEKIVGGWTVSGILNAHSGFPWNPIFNDLQGDAVYAGSGSQPLRAVAYNGGGGLSTDYSNDAFIKQRFSGGGATALFTAPSYVPGPALDDIINGTAVPGPIPTAPGVRRNPFRGPRYLNVDATLSKAFGLPKMKVLGEGAKIELRANFFNIFNKLNLANIQNNITDDHFGQAQDGLGGRTIEMQARFSF